MDDQGKLVEGQSQRNQNVTVHKIGEVHYYEVSDNELKSLENGGDSNSMKNIAISLISIFFSYLPVVILNEDKETFNHGVITTIMISTALFGAFFLFLSYRAQRKIKGLISDIRGR